MSKGLRLTAALLAVTAVSLPLAALGAGRVSLDKYHSYEEVLALLRNMQSAHPDLATLLSAGKSYQGRELWVVQVTNRKVGAPEEKPAVFIAGSLRGNEPVGTEVSLAVIDHLLSNYASDERVRQLVDSRTFYIWPLPNPDAHDATLKRPGNGQIANLRPTDEDRDGRFDEDGAEDLDGDGFIGQMKVKDEKGDFVPSRNDPRVLVPRGRRARAEVAYRLYREGVDSDGDGACNEDGPGGVLLNANFPVGWKLDTELPGSGMYPGSEPETEAMLRFLIDHPNVALLIVYQSGEGVLYRPFDSMEDKEIPRVDREVYELFGKRYQRITGYGLTHGYPEATRGDTTAAAEEEALKRGLAEELPGELSVEDILRLGNIRELVNSPEARTYIQQYGIGQSTIDKLIRLQELRQSGRRAASAPSERRRAPQYGTLLDWAYKDYNVYALSPSVWTLPAEYGATDTARKAAEEARWIGFLQDEWQGKGFIPWRPFRHPTLGEVEIGGWVDFYRWNPPPGKWLARVCQHQATFVVEAAELTPAITIAGVEVIPLQILGTTGQASASRSGDGAIVLTAGKGGDGALTLAQVKVTVQNTGPVATRCALGRRTRYAQQPPRAVLAYLEGQGGPLEFVSLPKVLRLGNLEGTHTKGLAVQERRQAEARTERRPPSGAEQEGETDQEVGTEPDRATGSWLVKIPNGVRALKVRVVAEKAGVAEKTVPLRW